MPTDDQYDGKQSATERNKALAALLMDFGPWNELEISSITRTANGWRCTYGVAPAAKKAGKKAAKKAGKKAAKKAAKKAGKKASKKKT